jgi:hypothetical protein
MGWGGGGGGGGEVGGVVGEDDPADLLGELAEDLIDVSTRRERVTAILFEAMEDVGGSSFASPLFLPSGMIVI